MKKNFLVLSLAFLVTTSFSVFGVDDVSYESPEFVSDAISEVVPEVISEDVNSDVVPEVVSEEVVQKVIPEIVKLSGSVIEPKHTFIIPLDKLQKDVKYDVTCTIHNNNKKYKKSEPLEIYVGNRNAKSDIILLNGQVVNTSGGMASELSTLTKDNSYQNIGLHYDESNIKMGYSYLTFINLDNESSINVDSCSANPVV